MCARAPLWLCVVDAFQYADTRFAHSCTCRLVCAPMHLQLIFCMHKHMCSHIIVMIMRLCIQKAAEHTQRISSIHMES